MCVSICVWWMCRRAWTEGGKPSWGVAGCASLLRDLIKKMSRNVMEPSLFVLSAHGPLNIYFGKAFLGSIHSEETGERTRERCLLFIFIVYFAVVYHLLHLL